MPSPNPNDSACKKPATPRLSRERQHLLQLLASSGHVGLTEAKMMAYGSSAMLAGMASDGFVTAVVDTVNVCDGTPKVRRFRITDAGRKAIERTMWRR
jgi:hypothetical protein